MKPSNLIQGKKYLVATYGVITTWNETTYLHKIQKTPTTRELFYFQGKEGIYPILRSELKKRVKYV